MIISGFQIAYYIADLVKILPDFARLLKFLMIFYLIWQTFYLNCFYAMLFRLILLGVIQAKSGVTKFVVNFLWHLATIFGRIQFMSTVFWSIFGVT
jgi:hypothetical protein